MAGHLPDAVAGFVEGPAPERTLVVFNRTEPEPVVAVLERAFAGLPVAVVDRHLTEGVPDLVCLLEEGEVTATSSLGRLGDAFLLVNVDRYRTGVERLGNAVAPDVLTGLDEVPFTVRGFPHSTKEKLLLVVVSRCIERRALAAGAGELRAAFQRLSRLDDEYGTRRVYEWLAESGVDTHVYGVPDADPDLGATVHTGDEAAYRDTWAVVFTPPEGGDGHAALLAVETGDNVWRGAWTFDPDRVARVRSYLRRQF